ncbi:MAG: PIN domain-containing protein [Chloroflexota bacterium]
MATPPVTADTSVIIPSILQWHALHRQAVALLKPVRRVPAHALIEAFSVLTRLPRPKALRPSQAYEALTHAFPGEPLTLTPGAYLAALRRLANADVGGGRVYDAIVGATAAEARALLLTADRRALVTYAVVGADCQLVE